MIDVIGVSNGDLAVLDSDAVKAANILQTQLGSLEYAPAFGIDLKFFLNPDFEFQNESFKAYLIQRIAEHQINVAGVLTQVEALFELHIFTVGDSDKESKGLIA